VQLEPEASVRRDRGWFVADNATPWMKVRFADGVPAGRWISLTYKLSMRNARSYFHARQFPMQNKDIIYVSSAPLNEVQKLLVLVGTVTNIVTGGAIVRSVTKNN